MSISLGNTEIGQIYLGATEIAEAYLGNTKVFENNPTPPPYDAKIEWLYSDGSAYIDTGINADGGLSVECSFKVPAIENKAIAGAIYNIGNNAYYRHHLSPFNQNIYYYGSTTLYVNSFSDTSNFHHLLFDVENGVFELDSSSLLFNASNFDCNCNYYLYARESSNMALQSRASYIAYFKMKSSGVLVRDFIPVRVGSIGYMYDKVSGQLFGNDGTGSFILGNDI